MVPLDRLQGHKLTYFIDSVGEIRDIAARQYMSELLLGFDVLSKGTSTYSLEEPGIKPLPLRVGRRQLYQLFFQLKYCRPKVDFGLGGAMLFLDWTVWAIMCQLAII